MRLNPLTEAVLFALMDTDRLIQINWEVDQAMKELPA